MEGLQKLAPELRGKSFQIGTIMVDEEGMESARAVRYITLLKSLFSYKTLTLKSGGAGGEVLE